MTASVPDSRRDQHSRGIAGVLGPVLVAVTVSEALHFDIWGESIPQLVYLNGMILFAGGVALVRFHNRWRPLWAAPITVVGWVMVAAGLFRLFAPRAPQAEPGLIAYGFIAVLCGLGLFLTYKGYVGGDEVEAERASHS